jgi:hypothetical protein
VRRAPQLRRRRFTTAGARPPGHRTAPSSRSAVPQHTPTACFALRRPVSSSARLLLGKGGPIRVRRTYCRRSAGRRGGRRSSGSAFSWNQDDVAAFVCDAHRRGRQRIARRGEQPTWAPSGRLVAYTGVVGIHLVRPDGRADRRLTAGRFDRSPGWSPDGRYLYCANRLNNRSIYMIDPENGDSIRICGESAEYLHVIEKELYFCINREWHKMSLSGGQYQKITRWTDEQ